MSIKLLFLTGALIGMAEIITADFAFADHVCSDPTKPSCGSAPPDTTGCKIFSNTTLTPGIYTGPVIEICADGVTLDGNGATIIDGQIVVPGRSNVTIKNFNFLVGNPAIFIQSGSSDIRILNNSITAKPNGTIGIWVINSSNLIIDSNTIDLTAGLGSLGIQLVGPAFGDVFTNCRISNNRITLGGSDFAQADIGISLSDYSGGLPYTGGNIITGNEIISTSSNNEDLGIEVATRSSANAVDSNRLTGISRGIIIYGGDSCRIRYNEIEGRREPSANFTYISGIEFQGGGLNNLVEGNRVRSFLGPGIKIAGAESTTVTLNTDSNNVFGLWGEGGLRGNKIFFNNFIDNDTQGVNYSYTTDFWDNDSVCGGNYWSDFDDSLEGCVDADGNGICDSERVQATATDTIIDRLPFVNRDGWLSPLIAKIQQACIPFPNLRLVPIQSVYLPWPNTNEPYKL
ncbi:MAG: right-handed parallel beta-helix repeat-containing protein, partial [candidate division Zixibacteria bacterium]|nr:right-handed parallel beta-helix repeat-containing protein [candidate division Zixibacteria bacterium]